MTFTTAFRSALARRLAYVLVAAALAWFGMGRAHAQQAGCTIESNNYVCQTRTQAYQQAKNVPVSTCSFSPSMCESLVEPLHYTIPQPDRFAGGYVPRWLVNFGPYDGKGERSATTTVNYLSECPPGYVWDDDSKTCNEPCDANAPPLTGGWVTGATLPYGVCVNKCTFSSESLPGDFKMTYITVDGETYWSLSGWKPTGEACTANDDTSTPPPPDADDDGVSDGNDPGPNNPGESGGTGDNPPSGDGNDSGDGSGNGNQSAGGGSCGAPPSSSGDAILAQIAYQTWATRCAIESAKDGNGNLKTTQGGSGTGSNPGTGTGSGTCGDGPVNAAICATKDFVKKISDFVTGATEEAAGLDTDHGELEEPESIWADPSDGPTLNASLFGGGGSCPAPPTYMGKSLDPGGNLCMFASIIGALVLVAAYAQAAYIIGRA